MKQLATVIIGLVIGCLTFSSFAGNPPANFSGTWVIDAEKSDPFPSGSTTTNLGSGGMGMGGMGGGMGMGGMGMGGMGGMGMGDMGDF